MPILSTTFGHGRLLARPGDRRLCLLDAAASALWDLHVSGLGPETLSALLVARFGLPPALARAQVTALVAEWGRAGLLAIGAAPPADWRLGAPDEPVCPAPRPRSPERGEWAPRVADRRVGLRCEAAAIHRRLGGLLAPGPAPDPEQDEPACVDHHLHLHGTVAAWRLARDGETLESGQGLDAALIATISVLTELGCRPAERLLVLHGAGLVTPGGQGLLLVAPGGSGKTTLAAALNATGFGLLSDDVVPVTLAGELLGLNLPLCLKPGSWPVLLGCRPDLSTAPPVQRYGQTVRFLPPLTPGVTQPVPPALLLLTRYQPGQAPAVVPVPPAAALQGLLAAEAVIRDLTQAKLEALARWVTRVPAWRLTYPDLETGLAGVRGLLAQEGTWV